MIKKNPQTIHIDIHTHIQTHTHTHTHIHTHIPNSITNVKLSTTFETKITQTFKLELN